MTGLQVADTLILPVEAVTETFAILAKRGAGKSNAAVVLAETMYDAGLPWVAIDPKGDWWGVRSSGDGKGAGLPVLVLGGQHADVPLEPTSGALVADLVVDQRLTAVLDVSLMSKADMRRFLADFAERLYQRNTEPLHVFAEEAHEYIPQRVTGPDARMVGAWEKLVKWGRTHGLGATLITQRTASLNNDVLTQVETLIALRTTGPSDQKAIRAWVDEHDAGAAMMAELRKLPSGSAFVVSPQWLELETPLRITFARRRTFDSGATPKAGQKRTNPRTLADVDLAAIKEAMAETIEKAAADDPKALRARIRDLEKQLAERPAIEPERVEVPALTDTEREYIEEFIRRWDDAYDRATEIVTTLRDELRRIDAPSSAPRRTTPVGQPQGRGEPTRAAKPSTAPTAARPVGDGSLGKAERAVLTAIAQKPNSSRELIAFLAQYSPKSSGFANALGRLRSLGLVAPGQPLRPLDGAEAALGGVDPLPDGDALRAFWISRLGRAEAAVLNILIDAHPTELARGDLANLAGYSAASSGYANALGRLRSLGLVKKGGFVITDDLAEALGLAE